MPRPDDVPTCNYVWRSSHIVAPPNRFMPGSTNTCELCYMEDRLRPYGLTYWEYARMRDAQGEICALCGHKPTGIYPDVFCVDHDHSVTDKTVIRGLLCQQCNMRLGHARDDVQWMQRAITYLQREPQAISKKKPRTQQQEEA